MLKECCWQRTICLKSKKEKVEETEISSQKKEKEKVVGLTDAENRMIVARGRGVRGLCKKGEGIKNYTWVVTK